MNVLEETLYEDGTFEAYVNIFGHDYYVSHTNKGGLKITGNDRRREARWKSKSRTKMIEEFVASRLKGPVK